MKAIGLYKIEIIRKGESVKTLRGHNNITTVGFNKLLDIGFRNQTQIAHWYIRLINASSPPALDIGDTLSTHVGWSEFTDIDAAAEWVTAAAGSGTIGNTATADVTVSAAGSIFGFFVTDASSGTSGTLWATAIFDSGSVAVLDDDVLKITYTIQLSNV